MEVTITLTGTPREIEAVLPQLRDLDVETVAVNELDQWKLGLAIQLMDTIPRRGREIIEAVVHTGGKISTEDLRGPESESLRGALGPITKAMRRLEKEGRLPPGLPRPVTAIYKGNGTGGRRAMALVMPHDLLPIFAKAIVMSRNFGDEVTQ